MGKKKKEKRFKNLLKENEIWFTTIASIALSVMALFLTINSNNLSKRQTAIDYSTHEPNFHIYKSFFSTAENGIVDDIEIIVKNRNNGIIKNLEISQRIFLNIEISKLHYSFRKDLNLEDYKMMENNRKKYRFFLLDQFYDQRHKDDDLTILSRIGSPNINHSAYIGDSIHLLATQEQKIQLFYLLLNKELKESNLTISKLQREILLEIKYLDFMNEQKTEYFKIFLGPIKHELYNNDKYNKNTKAAELVTPQKKGVEMFYNGKYNYISFVGINRVQHILDKLEEKESYTFDNIPFPRSTYFKKKIKSKDSIEKIPSDSLRIIHDIQVKKSRKWLEEFNKNQLEELIMEIKLNDSIKMSRFKNKYNLN